MSQGERSKRQQRLSTSASFGISEATARKRTPGRERGVCAYARQQALALTYKYKTPPAPTLTTVKFFGFSSYTLDFVVGAVSLRLWPLLMPSKNPSSFRRMAIGERGESGCDGTSLCVLLWCRSRVGGLPNCAVSFWRLRAIVPFSIMLSH